MLGGSAPAAVQKLAQAVTQARAQAKAQAGLKQRLRQALAIILSGNINSLGEASFSDPLEVSRVYETSSP